MEQGRAVAPVLVSAVAVVAKGQLGQLAALKQVEEQADYDINRRQSSGRYGNVVRVWDGTVSPT